MAKTDRAKVADDKVTITEQQDWVTFTSEVDPSLGVTASRRNRADDADENPEWVFNPHLILSGSVDGVPTEFVCTSEEDRDRFAEQIIGLMMDRKQAITKAHSDFNDGVVELVV